MKKIISIIWVFCFISLFEVNNLKAQIVYDISGPSPFSTSNFLFNAGPTSTNGFSIWHQYNTGGTGNTWSAAYTMPFTFEFFGDTVSHFILSKNYLLSFDTTLANTSVNSNIDDNTALPNPNLPDKTIAGFWDNYANGTGTLGTNDNIWIGVFGTAPNRQLFIKFFSLETGGRNFSYGHWVLEESTNNIYFIDIYMGGTSGSMTVGIQKDSTTAFQLAGSPNILPIVTSTAWSALEYYIFDPRFLVTDDAGVASIDNPSSPFTTGNQMVSTTIANYGNNNLNSVSVNWSVNGVNQTAVPYTNTIAVDSSAAINLGMFNFTGISTIEVWTSSPNGVADNLNTNDTMSITLYPSLSGNYTIDSANITSGNNFQSFSDLASSLNQGGVNGAVIVDVAAGIYNDQFSLETIAGSSSANSIIIDGGGVSTLTHDKTIRNSTITLEGSSYITIKNMNIAATGGTDSWGIHLFDSAHHIVIDSNNINLPVSATIDVAGIIASNDETSDAIQGNNAFDITISNNNIDGGERGISIYGSFNASLRNQNISIINNNFTNNNRTAIYLIGYNNATISNNFATTLSTAGVACYLSDLENFTISRNFFSGQDMGLDADDLNFDNPATGKSTITNNMFIGGDDAIFLDDVRDIDFFHNSTYGEDYGIYINDPVNLDIRNNIFYSNSDYAFYSVDNVPYTDINYNIYYTNGANLVNFGNIIFTDLTAFQAGQNAYNSNSIEADPIYVNNLNDLHLSGTIANDVGDTTVGVIIDFDGDRRPLAPSSIVDIGADEFTPPAPYYPIGVINTVDSLGVADSLGLVMQTSGTVVGIDLDGNNGISFFIIDMSTSSQEGISVFNFNDVSNYVVNEGDSIRVWGDVDQFNGQQQIFADSIELISTNAFVPAARGVNNLDESTEANHISLIDDFVLLDPSGTGSYNMDATNGTDTITIRVDFDTDINDSLNVPGQNLVVGDTICGLSGVGGQFDNSSPYTSGYQVFPMRFSDITICRLPVGLEKNANDVSFSIAPNPTNGQFTITTSKLTSANAQLIVRDISGKVIFEERIISSGSSFTKTFDLSGNAKGIYFITVIDGNNRFNQKLIKQ